MESTLSAFTSLSSLFSFKYPFGCTGRVIAVRSFSVVVNRGYFLVTVHGLAMGSYSRCCRAQAAQGWDPSSCPAWAMTVPAPSPGQGSSYVLWTSAASPRHVGSFWSRRGPNPCLLHTTKWFFTLSTEGSSLITVLINLTLWLFLYA